MTRRTGLLAPWPILLLIALVPVTGCLDSSGSRSSDPPPDDAATASRLLAARITTGGRCAAGPCRDEVRVYADGRWYQRGTSGKASGDLDDAAMSRLRGALNRTRVPELIGAAKGSCASDYDGPEVSYRTSETSAGGVSACVHGFPATDPLVTWWQQRSFTG